VAQVVRLARELFHEEAMDGRAALQRLVAIHEPQRAVIREEPTEAGCVARVPGLVEDFPERPGDDLGPRVAVAGCGIRGGRGRSEHGGRHQECD
jgi:hypothetical protein